MSMTWRTLILGLSLLASGCASTPSSPVRSAEDITEALSSEGVYLVLTGDDGGFMLSRPSTPGFESFSDDLSDLRARLGNRVSWIKGDSWIQSLEPKGERQAAIARLGPDFSVSSGGGTSAHTLNVGGQSWLLVVLHSGTEISPKILDQVARAKDSRVALIYHQHWTDSRPRLSCPLGVARPCDPESPALQALDRFEPGRIDLLFVTGQRQTTVKQVRGTWVLANPPNLGAYQVVYSPFTLKQKIEIVGPASPVLKQKSEPFWVDARSRQARLEATVIRDRPIELTHVEDCSRESPWGHWVTDQVRTRLAAGAVTLPCLSLGAPPSGPIREADLMRMVPIDFELKRSRLSSSAATERLKAEVSHARFVPLFSGGELTFFVNRSRIPTRLVSAKLPNPLQWVEIEQGEATGITLRDVVREAITEAATFDPPRTRWKIQAPREKRRKRR